MTVPGDDVGTVTAELAVALPGVVLMCAALLYVGQAVVDDVRCVDAARAGARIAARGDPMPAVAQEVTRRAPAGAHVQVARSGSDVRVEVRVALRGTGIGWAGLAVRGSATASVETP